MGVKGLPYYLFVQSFLVFMVASCYEFNIGDQYQLQFSCNPVEDCANGTAGDKVPDPYNCNNYYLCIEIVGDDNPTPSSNPVACGTGLYFDQETAECEPGLSCQNLCVNMCKTTCVSAGDFLFYPCDPSKYYTCIEGQPPSLSTCPDEMYFNGVDCTSSEDDTCDNCTPFCDEINIETFDPLDCKSYYLCTEEGIPSEDNHYECAEGQYFDADVGTCENEIRECKSFCGCSDETTTALTTAEISTTPMEYTTTMSEVTSAEVTSTEVTSAEVTSAEVTSKESLTTDLATWEYTTLNTAPDSDKIQ